MAQLALPGRSKLLPQQGSIIDGLLFAGQLSGSQSTYDDTGETMLHAASFCLCSVSALSTSCRIGTLTRSLELCSRHEGTFRGSLSSAEEVGTTSRDDVTVENMITARVRPALARFRLETNTSSNSR